MNAVASAFRDPAGFAFATALQSAWRAVYDEYLGARDRLVDWVEPELYGEGWKVLGLFDFPHGRLLPENAARCPHTARLVGTHFPTHGAAGFSVLLPGTRIQPHRGYAGQFLRCHLGLRVPEGDCGLRVGDELRRWREGELLVFDDRLEHEAWNLTDETRVILLVDFIPQSGAPAPAAKESDNA